MALHAVAHFERQHLLYLFHLRHVAVAGGADGAFRYAVALGEEAYVRFVYEVNMVGDPVDAHPVYWAVVGYHFAKLFHLRQVVAYDLVASEAQPGGWDGRGRPLVNITMAEYAVQPQFVDVLGVREGNRLVWAFVVAEYDGRSQPRGYDESKPERNSDERRKAHNAEYT